MEQHANQIPQDLKFQLLEEITENFSPEYKVGSGGFGEVYKGQLPNGEVIAVKKLYRIDGLDDVEFKKEFKNLMKAQHRNVIRLVAYSHETRQKYVQVDKEYVFAKVIERALCFEYMMHGSLDKYLSDESSGHDWHTRYNIIKGVCEGLNFLHNGSKEHLYHLDLKPTNILLDENMMPKIADFGLSRIFSKTVTYAAKRFIGTRGYMPPEYIEKNHITNKYDVFSLGVIIIQIMAGPSGYSIYAELSDPQRFAELVHENWTTRLDAESRHTSQADSLAVKTCIDMALRCVEPDRKKRPTIAEIVSELNEMDILKMSLLEGQSSESKQLVEIDPLEVRFPFELNKQSSFALQLTNKSDDFVAFYVKSNQSKYSARPDRAVMPPHSKRYIVVAMHPQDEAPRDMQSCRDMFVVQCAAVSEGFLPGNITENLFRGTAAGGVELPIVYVEVTET